MPELPEITLLARQIDQHLTGKTISQIVVLQPKCLNTAVEVFTGALTGASLRGASHRGKWILVDTDRGWLLLNLGMGGELLLVPPDQLPDKHRLVFYFTDGTCLAVNFWWFGYAHWVPADGLQTHEMVGSLGPNALDLSLDDFRALLQGQRGRIKTFLCDQSRIAGIGNSYIHDILYFARLHPLRKIDSLTAAEIEQLYTGMRSGLLASLDKGGANYEQDLFGKKGGFGIQDILIGYREGQPCPGCGTPISKIKTGGTSSFICSTCQPAN